MIRTRFSNLTSQCKWGPDRSKRMLSVPGSAISRNRQVPGGFSSGRNPGRAYLPAIAWVASLFVLFEPSAARAKINMAGLLAPYSFLAWRAPRLHPGGGTASDAHEGATTAAMGIGTWRLVRTPGSRGGPGEVSIAQTADASRSDIDLVGLMLRCSDTGFDVLVIFLKPLPPRAHPKVNLTTGGSTVQLDATVVSPGAAILLPPAAAALVNGSWQTFSELEIEIDDGSGVVRGVISLAGLGQALSLLTSSCLSR
jgi:hypothetical protein